MMLTIIFFQNLEISKTEVFYALSGSKKGLYGYLEKEMKLYLPRLENKCITDNYLEGALKNELLILAKEKIKEPIFVKKCSRHELVLELVNILDNVIRKNDETKNIRLGFDETNPANKKWLINMLYTLNENHELFQKIPTTIDKDLLEKLDKRLYFSFIYF